MNRLEVKSKDINNKFESLQKYIPKILGGSKKSYKFPQEKN